LQLVEECLASVVARRASVGGFDGGPDVILSQGPEALLVSLCGSNAWIQSPARVTGETHRATAGLREPPRDRLVAKEVPHPAKLVVYQGIHRVKH
jgi:hypothetical protein